MKRSKAIPAICDTLRRELPGVRITGAPNKFARGNKAASKGEPRIVSLTVRLPVGTAQRLSDMAYGRCTRADMIIGLIEEAAAHPPAV